MIYYIFIKDNIVTDYIDYEYAYLKIADEQQLVFNFSDGSLYITKEDKES